jgi:hypothetical protein
VTLPRAYVKISEAALFDSIQYDRNTTRQQSAAGYCEQKGGRTLVAIQQVYKTALDHQDAKGGCGTG